MSLHFGDAHTPEAIDRYTREHRAEIDELIASGELDEKPAAKALTDEEIEAMTDDLGPEDLERAIASRTPGMQALLNAEPED